MDKSSALPLILSLALVAGPSAAVAATDPVTAPAQRSATDADAGKKVCKWVLSAERGTKPYQLCLSPAAWALRDKLAAKDATRQECHIVPKTGWHFESTKVCMPASEWENQQLQARQAIEKIQAGSCAGGAAC
jgi:hypothetical protein